ncbi:MAG: phenylacetate-CoA oxygenase subunit PaaI [Alphaproteobacteria bacterium]|nr:MAG: phenylacetate-CoA oxygenase subunit PaaI [Alphaproteobacteria bacterium]
MTDQLFDALIELADDNLVLGHRLSEWCGHAPMLEEDLALANLALDLVGTARALYSLAAEVEGKGRTEDDLAYLRVEREYRNLLLVERPNGDFGHTILRQFYFAAFMEPFWSAAAAGSSDARIRAIAAKAAKEMAYHLRHSGEWVVRLGDGTDESHRRMVAAVDALHHYTDELFVASPAAEAMAGAGVLPRREAMRAEWDRLVGQVLAEAGLTAPDVPWPQIGGREGLHGEELGHMLAEMQYLQRAYPGATW